MKRLPTPEPHKSLLKKYSNIRLKLVEESTKTPEVNLRKSILKKNNFRINIGSEDTVLSDQAVSTEESPVCSVFNHVDDIKTDTVSPFGTPGPTPLGYPDTLQKDNIAVDGRSRDMCNDLAEGLVRRSEDEVVDDVEMSMKSVVLSSDNYSDSASDQEIPSVSKGSESTETIEQPLNHLKKVGIIKHKPPKPQHKKHSPEVTIYDKGKTAAKTDGSNRSDDDLSFSASTANMAESIVLSSDEYSLETGVEDENVKEQKIQTGGPQTVEYVPKAKSFTLNKKRVSFGSVVDTYWEEHWSNFWKATSENRDSIHMADAEHALEDVKSQDFSPVLTSTQKDHDNLDGHKDNTASDTSKSELIGPATSTPFPAIDIRAIQGGTGSSSSDEFSPVDSTNSSCNSTQEAILRAIAVLECSGGSQASSLKTQSSTQESRDSTQNSGSTRTSEWESEIVTSGSTNAADYLEKHHASDLPDISKADSIDEIADIISRTCTKEALKAIPATATPVELGNSFLPPPKVFTPSPLVCMKNYLCETSAPIVNLSERLCEQMMDDSCDQSLDDTDVYLGIRSISGKDQVVPSETVKSLPSDVHISAVGRNEEIIVQDGIQDVKFGNMKNWEWNDKFCAQTYGNIMWEEVRQTAGFEQIAKESVLEPILLMTQIHSSSPPVIHSDVTTSLSRSALPDDGLYQTRFFPSLDSPNSSSKSYFTGDTDKVLHGSGDNLLMKSTLMKSRYFKSPDSPEYCQKDLIPDSCTRFNVREMLPMLHNLGMSPPVFADLQNSSTKPCPDDCLSPTFPFLRGKVTTIIDVLQDSPERCRYSKDSDRSDSKSIESTPKGTPDSSSEDSMSLPHQTQQSSSDDSNSRCSDGAINSTSQHTQFCDPIPFQEDRRSSNDENAYNTRISNETGCIDVRTERSPLHVDASNDDLHGNEEISLEEADSYVYAGLNYNTKSDTSLKNSRSDDDLLLSNILSDNELESRISDLERSQSSICGSDYLNQNRPRNVSKIFNEFVTDGNLASNLNDRVEQFNPDEPHSGCSDILDPDVVENSISLEAGGTVADKTWTKDERKEETKYEQTRSRSENDITIKDDVTNDSILAKGHKECKDHMVNVKQTDNSANVDAMRASETEEQLIDQIGDYADHLTDVENSDTDCDDLAIDEHVDDSRIRTLEDGKDRDADVRVRKKHALHNEETGNNEGDVSKMSKNGAETYQDKPDSSEGGKTSVTNNESIANGDEKDIENTEDVNETGDNANVNEVNETEEGVIYQLDDEKADDEFYVDHYGSLVDHEDVNDPRVDDCEEHKGQESSAWTEDSDKSVERNMQDMHEDDITVVNGSLETPSNNSVQEEASHNEAQSCQNELDTFQHKKKTPLINDENIDNGYRGDKDDTEDVNKTGDKASMNEINETEEHPGDQIGDGNTNTDNYTNEDLVDHCKSLRGDKGVKDSRIDEFEEERSDEIEDNSINTIVDVKSDEEGIGADEEASSTVDDDSWETLSDESAQEEKQLCQNEHETSEKDNKSFQKQNDAPVKEKDILTCKNDSADYGVHISGAAEPLALRQEAELETPGLIEK